MTSEKVIIIKKKRAIDYSENTHNYFSVESVDGVGSLFLILKISGHGNNDFVYVTQKKVVSNTLCRFQITGQKPKKMHVTTLISLTVERFVVSQFLITNADRLSCIIRPSSVISVGECY